jgi:N-acetyltransferase
MANMNFKSNFENDSISLYQIKERNFEELYLIASDPSIWEQHPENDRWKKEKFSIFLKNGYDNEFGFLLIFDKDKKQIIGSTRFYSYDENDKAIRIGYTFILPEYWGTSINFQIKKMMLAYAFKFLDKVYFDIGVNNFRSRKAVEKLGASLFEDNKVGNVVYLLKKIKFINQISNP